MLKNRRSRLKPFFENNRLDAILVTNLRNIRYLSGFSGSDGALLISQTGAWFLCDSRYVSQAEGEVAGAEVREYALRLDAIAAVISEQRFERLGFEAAYTSVADHKKLAERVSAVELVAIDPSLDDIRSRKELSEIECLERVAALASKSLMQVLPQIRPGISEAEIAVALEYEMRRNGADGSSFDFVVASGVRGAMPHGRASDRRIQAGELVTIDFGAVKDGYCSDETVTVACGEPGSREKEIYAIVREAHDRAIMAVAPGVSCRELDAVARDHIARHGYGDRFGHGLGHGVGLDIHESPTVSPRSSAVLEEGMVITIEPGIYIPGFGGVRIEDMLLVTADGCRCLTSVDKQLLVL